MTTSKEQDFFGGIVGGFSDFFEGIVGKCATRKDEHAVLSPTRTSPARGARTVYTDTANRSRTFSSRPTSRQGSRPTSQQGSSEGSCDSRGDVNRPPSRTGSATSNGSDKGNKSDVSAIFLQAQRMGRSGSTGGNGSRSRSRSQSKDRSPGMGRLSFSGSGSEDENSLLNTGDVTLFKANWRSFELFKKLDDLDVNRCIKRMKVRTFKDGEKIIKKGSIGTTMFFIDLGTARAEVRGQTATQLKSGDYFGEMAFIATCKKFLRDKSDSEAPQQAIRVADVIANGACRILEFSVKDFMTVLQNNNNTNNKQVLASLAGTMSERKANVERIEKAYGKHKEAVREHGNPNSGNHIKKSMSTADDARYG